MNAISFVNIFNTLFQIFCYYSALRLHSNSYAQKLCILHNFAREKLGFSVTFAHKKHLAVFIAEL